jgi:phosphoglycolate phosphatase
MHRALAIEPGQSKPLQHLTAMRSPSPLTVFCDFDGPIIDVSDRYYQTYQLGLVDVQALYQAQGIKLPIAPLSKEQFWSMKQNRVPDQEIALQSGLQGTQIEHFLQRVSHIVNQPTLLCQDRLQPGVRWALTLLHAQGVRLVLVTLRCQEQAIQVLKGYGLLQLFCDIWGTQDQQAAYRNLAEQKTKLLALAAERSHLKNAWMIGDTEADVIAGQRVGIPTIALTCGIRSSAYLKQFEPTRMHNDLLSAAHFLVYQQEVASVVA